MPHSIPPDIPVQEDGQHNVGQITEQLANLQHHTSESRPPSTEPNTSAAVRATTAPRGSPAPIIDLTCDEGGSQEPEASTYHKTIEQDYTTKAYEKLESIDLTPEDDKQTPQVPTTSTNIRKRQGSPEDEQSENEDHYDRSSRSKRVRRSTTNSDGERRTIEVIDLTEDEVNNDCENIIDLDDILSSDDEVQIVHVRKCNQELRRLKQKRKQRIRQVLDRSRSTVSQITINEVKIEEGSCVEFHDETFMKVCAIYPDKKHEFVLVGKMFTRITDKEVIMPRLRDSDKSWGPPTLEIAKLPRYLRGWELLNEVCQRIKIAAREADHDQGLWRRSCQEVKRVRKLMMTNQPYEQNCLSQRDALVAGIVEATVKRRGLLRCRWKETIITDEYGKVKEHKLDRPTKDEVLLRNFSTEAHLRSRWRGPTRNLELTKVKPVMAEGFCGAGGMTSGALKAGMDVKVAFDYDAAKIATHDLNFPECDSKQVDVYQWISWAKTKAFKVDVVHLSPPCQPFSAANTIPNEAKNERNQAVLLACGLAIESLHPRVVTLEESDGLLNRHGQWFGALVSQLTELGFSIRWACLKCSDFGVPQTRTRVFLLASAPGEDLPTFPEPTHGPGTVSIQTTLDDVARHHNITPLSHHNPESMREIDKPSYDARRLANCITCKGGDNNYHPDGRRPFTIREFLALQTFSHSFRFPATFSGRPFTRTEMKVQLGNAVPPLMGAALMRKVLASLIATDKRRLIESGGSDEANPIQL